MRSAGSRPAPLANALNAQRPAFMTRFERRAAYYFDPRGKGRPLVLIHSINAAPSSFEIKPLFEHYRSKRPVYSLDLPGFGHSDRPSGPYSPERFADVLVDFIVQVVGQPADVIALSLSCEFAARAACSAPEQFASLVLISPTGFSRRRPPGPGVARLAHRMLTLPAVSQWLYDLVASRRSIRYFLGRSFTGEVPEAMVDYAYATSHQPGARHAPLTFLSGKLFTRDIMEGFYARLIDRPVLAIADQDPYISFEKLEGFVAEHANWQFMSLAPHLGLPHWEKCPETVVALDGFWATMEAPSA